MVGVKHDVAAEKLGGGGLGSFEHLPKVYLSSLRVKL